MLRIDDVCVFPGTYRADCGHERYFEKGERFILCRRCRQGFRWKIVKWADPQIP